MKRFIFLVILSIFGFSLASTAQEKEMVITNHKDVPKIVDNFVDGAIYNGIDYRKELYNLKSIKLVPGNNGFVGRFTGQTIEVNEKLKNYPHLLRIVIYRQIGKMYGLKTDKSGKLTVMSERWEISPQYESYAYQGLKRPFLRRKFFLDLKKVKPIDKEI